jgi:uncharacterized membrane protein HdeD (DUF308 family)
MKYKQKVEFIESLFLLLVGIVLVLLPIYVEPKIEIVIRLIFALYAVINLVQYILTFKSKDIEGLITFFISLLAIGSTFLFNVSEPKGLAMSLMAWITLMSVAKLTKVDYYHDKKDRMWKYRLLNLILFILTGIATAISLTYASSVQTIIIGFFMIIHAILELFDPIIKSLIAHA